MHSFMQTSRSLAALALEAWAAEVGQQAVAEALERSQETVSRYISGHVVSRDYYVRQRALDGRGIALDAWETYPPDAPSHNETPIAAGQGDRAISRDRRVVGSGEVRT